MTPGHERLNGPLRALNLNSDRAVIFVADIPCQTGKVSPRLHRPAESDSLHATFHADIDVFMHRTAPLRVFVTPGKRRVKPPVFCAGGTRTLKLSSLPYVGSRDTTGTQTHGWAMAQKRFVITVSRDCCKGCQLCITVCPKKVLGRSRTLNCKGHQHAEALRPTDCIGCLQCADICPDAAIQIDVEESG